MKAIRRGLEQGLDISVYAKPEFDGCQMEEIRDGLESGVDVSTYADPNLDWEVMCAQREALVLEEKEPELSSTLKMMVAAMTQKSQKKEKEQDFDLER